MSPAKVIIAGGGIAGPILAIVLKEKGYEPVIYERHDSIPDAGLSMCLQPNGLRVLSTIPGLVESLEGRTIERFLLQSVLPEDPGVLADSDAPTRMKEAYGYGMFGVRRTTFHRQIVEFAEKSGVKIVWGHTLVDLEQHEDSVTVKFENGNTDTASFVVGCDGLHSGTRIALFGKEEASFTGLVQTGGVSPIPASLGSVPVMMNVFGNGEHFIGYPVTNSLLSWATTGRESEAKETWRAMGEEAQQKFREGPYSAWGCSVGEIVPSAPKIIKFGLYDRPELKTWHKGRVVLIGDAAHPTSPHLGQGANQAFEDIALLVELLQKHNPAAGEPSSETLETLFTEFETVRIPRSALLVKEARKQGDNRVAEGVENCKQRNNIVRATWKNDESVAAHYSKIVKVKEAGQAE